MRALLMALALLACGHGQHPRSDRVTLQIDPGEATAVLAMARAPDDAAWARVVGTAGYQRLRTRELGMGRPFDEAAMRSFAQSAELAAQGPALAETVARWSAVDLDVIANRVLGYLPREARIAATIYPVIKPRSNSFVNRDERGAAIFVFVDPAQTAAQFENTIAHELHHIGFASLPEEACAASPGVCAARTWSGAFGEGFAMLAAAGGPEVHPHRFSKPADRVRWDRDVARFDADLAEVQQFLGDVMAGRLDEEAARTRAMGFFGVQGPWYTVGWTMAVAIERCFGRARLIEAMRRPWRVLGLYNASHAACPTGGGGATWDAELVRVLDDAKAA